MATGKVARAFSRYTMVHIEHVLALGDRRQPPSELDVSARAATSLGGSGSYDWVVFLLLLMLFLLLLFSGV